MSKNLYWIWFSQRIGIAKKGFVEILEHFGDPQNVYDAEAPELYSLKDGKNNKLIESLLNKELDEAYDIEKYCAKRGISILKYGEDDYPKLLTNLRNPPVILYAKGTIKNLNQKVAISVVGMRRLTEYGRRSAYKIGYELSAAGVVVVGGLAYGIDAVGACGALDAGGRAIAVLGGGIDNVYPKEHKKLLDQIAKRGMVVSEYPPLMASEPQNFPIRNRIISGLSHGTLVVEADGRSGSLITARAAIMQGRNVFAMPGNIDNKSSDGTNALIKSGAIPITSAADILENYRYIYGESLDLTALAGIDARSSLKRGALSSRGVDEGKDFVGEEKRGVLGSLLHKRKRIDGKTVNELAGNTEYPRFEASPTLKKETAKPDNKVETNEQAIEVDYSKILDGLDKKYSDIFYAMPKNKAVGLDTFSGLGYNMIEIMSVMSFLEIKKMIKVLPGGQYIREQ